jgi:ferredoxin
VTEPTLRIDADRCQGHAICYLLVPDLFEVDEDGRGSVIRDTMRSDGDQEQAAIAIDRCPEHAISLRSA